MMRCGGGGVGGVVAGMELIRWWRRMLRLDGCQGTADRAMGC